MSAPRVIRPAPAFRTKILLTTLLVFVLLILPYILLGLIPELGWTYVILFMAANAAWLAVTWWFVPLYVRSITYELGEDEIVVRKGLITRSVQTVPYRTIMNVAVKRGPLDRRYGLGSIAVHTAGYSQEGGPEAKLSGLADCDTVYAEIMAAARRHRSGLGEEAAATETVPGLQAPTGTEALLTAILAELRGIRQRIETANGLKDD